MKTDSQLQQDVIAELQWTPSVHAEHIGVAVQDGVVKLSGHVGSYLEKINAERAAQSVSGVRALAVEVEVKLTSFGKRDDTTIASSVQSALEWLGTPTSKNVKVLVEKGWVTLSGNLDWQYQRLAAARAVQFLMGVTGVSNQIGIKPGATLVAVKNEIEAALARRSKVDASRIHVQVDGSAVTLSGVVQSWSERDSARESAWGAPGVMRVNDNMTVAN
jgi:osmotically-inducible protein OsmY